MTHHCTRAFLTFVVFVVLLLTAGCGEIPTSVKVGNGPTFLFHGSGQLASFRVYGPQPSHNIATPFDDKSLVWRVQPVEGYFKGAQVQGLTVAYGVLPKGYTQMIPKNAAPIPLSQGHVYYFFAETTNAPPADGFIYLDRGTPIEITVPDLCQSGFVGEVKPLKCGTNEPYVEPVNLEQFVRENHLQK